MQVRKDKNYAEDDQKGELKSSLIKLLRLPEQNDERRGKKRIDQVSRPLQNPSDNENAEHNGRSNGRSGPARERGIKPNQWNQYYSAKRTRQADGPKKAKKDAENNRHPQAIDRENVIGGRAHEWFGDLLGERGFPAQRQCPLQPQSLIFGGQSERQSPARPGPKTIRQGRCRRRGNHPPVFFGASLQLIIDPQLLQVRTVIECPLGHRGSGQ